MHGTIFTLLLAPAPRETCAKLHPERSRVWAQGSHFSFHVPGLVIAVPPSWLVFESYRSARVGRDGMLPQEAEEGTRAACLHKAWHKFWSRVGTQHRDALWSYAAPHGRWIHFSLIKMGLKGGLWTVFSIHFWVGVGEEKTLFGRSKGRRNFRFKSSVFFIFLLYLTEGHHKKSLASPHLRGTLWCHPYSSLRCCNSTTARNLTTLLSAQAHTINLHRLGASSNSSSTLGKNLI